jgi:TolB-like protein
LKIFEETHLNEKRRIINSNNFQTKNYQVNFVAKLTLLDSIKAFLNTSNDDDSKMFVDEITSNLINQITSILQSHKLALEESKRTLK